jgi:ZIP family zinc transporter
MMVFLLTVAASVAALIGGYTAIRSRHWLNLATSSAAGLVLGLVTFDLLPEVFAITQAEELDPVWPMVALISGFLLFHLFEKFVPLHHASEEKYGPHKHPRLGVARALALTGHSFLDGLSIGVAFQVNAQVGAAVALAVIGHRFADGFDTTSFMLYHNNKLIHIRRWLAAVILMPVFGGLASLAISLSEKTLAVYLSFFAGLLLYIAASNLVPQAHTENKSRLSIALTIAGVILIFFITRVSLE